ncbi:MAG: S24 family peptidase [Succinivibrionaceae bacterium]|nr:S24 family peptidase [Succinivibrionaceae bacterium]
MANLQEARPSTETKTAAVPLYVPAPGRDDADYVQAEPDGYSFFPSSVFDKYGVRIENCVAIRSADEEMKPTINQGDEMLVHRIVSGVERDKIYVYLLRGRHGVGRFEEGADGTLTILRDNPDCPGTIQVTPQERKDPKAFEIVGKVLARLSLF